MHVMLSVGICLIAGSCGVSTRVCQVRLLREAVRIRVGHESRLCGGRDPPKSEGPGAAGNLHPKGR